ncbi:hypothetical protein ACOMHN_048669 [Nucella lapillus]
MALISCSLSSLLLLSLFTGSTAFFVFKFGKCSKPPVKQDFDVTRYLGKWWEYKRFPAPFEIASTCGFANYTLIAIRSRSSTPAYKRSTCDLFFKYRKPIVAVGEAVVVDPAKPGELQVSFGNMPAGDGKPNYFVVDTDYENFAVVFSCSDFGIGNIQFLWILTRAQGRRPDNQGAIEKTLTNSGVDLRPFITVELTDC